MTHYHTVYVRCLDRSISFTRCGWCGRKLADGVTDCHEATGEYCEPALDYLHEQQWMEEEMQREYEAEELRQAYNRLQWQEYFEQERREQEAYWAKRNKR